MLKTIPAMAKFFFADFRLIIPKIKPSTALIKETKNKPVKNIPICCEAPISPNLATPNTTEYNNNIDPVLIMPNIKEITAF